MHIAVLGASGATGEQLALQALDRGHHVTAIARDPARLALPHTTRLRAVAGDVHHPQSIVRALTEAEGVVSGLGTNARAVRGTLLAGAIAVVASGVPRIVWLGAFGTGPSAVRAGHAATTILRLMLGREVADKEAADAAILVRNGTVFHAGPLSNGPLSPDYEVLALNEVPRRLLPASISRATVAAAMLDEVEHLPRAGVLVPIARPTRRKA